MPSSPTAPPPPSGLYAELLAHDSPEHKDGECLICYEVPHTWGMLDCCAHSFCYECINEWKARKESDGERMSIPELEARDTCPACRRTFKVLMPTPKLFAEGEDKEEAFTSYRAMLSQLPCPDLNESDTGHLYCPQGRDCLYSHIVDGPGGPQTCTFTHTYHDHVVMQERLENERLARRILLARYAGDPYRVAGLVVAQGTTPAVAEIVNDVEQLMLRGQLAEFQRTMLALGMDNHWWLAREGASAAEGEEEWTDEDEDEDEDSDEDEDADDSDLEDSNGSSASDSDSEGMPALEEIDSSSSSTESYADSDSELAAIPRRNDHQPPLPGRYPHTPPAFSNGHSRTSSATASIRRFMDATLQERLELRRLAERDLAQRWGDYDSASEADTSGGEEEEEEGSRSDSLPELEDIDASASDDQDESDGAGVVPHPRARALPTPPWSRFAAGPVVEDEEEDEDDDVEDDRAFALATALARLNPALARAMARSLRAERALGRYSDDEDADEVEDDEVGMRRRLANMQLWGRYRDHSDDDDDDEEEEEEGELGSSRVGEDVDSEDDMPPLEPLHPARDVDLEEEEDGGLPPVADVDDAPPPLPPVASTSRAAPPFSAPSWAPPSGLQAAARRKAAQK
ncbi:hypothetical protein JCM1840_003156 [Sporobolomyces johnsonii]